MRTILLVMLLFPIFGVIAQNRTIQEIELEIKEAVNAGNYTLAARLKKEKELTEEIQTAVNTGDYEKAARLKKQLGSETSSTTNTSVKPEFINQVYLYDEASKTLSKLEKREAEIKTSVAAAPFYASATSYYFISSNNSSVEIKSGSSFVVETSSGVDPSDVFKMAKFDPDRKGNDRYLPYSNSTSAGYGGATSSQLNENDIAISFSKIGDNIYKIIPANELSDGEYAFIYGKKFFCFRVGPIPSTSTPPATATVSSSNNGIPEVIRSGIFMSILFGPASGGTTVYGDGFYGTSVNYTSLAGVYLGYKVGNKMYFGSNKKFRSGIKLTWIRVGGYITTDAAFYLQVAPIGVGYTAGLALTEDIALEAGVNFGANLLLLPELDINYIGVMLNPEVKFRYKVFSAGLEFLYSGLNDISTYPEESTAVYSSNTYFGTFNVSIGVDF